jgi:transposase InsO family protein
MRAGCSESGYYAWKGRPDPPRTLRRIWLAGEIADVHKASGGTYGSQRVTAELRYGREIVVGHNTVGKIMSELGLKGLPTRRLPKGARMAQVTRRRHSALGMLSPSEYEDLHNTTQAA